MTVQARVDRAINDLFKANEMLMKRTTRDEYMVVEKARQTIRNTYFDLKHAEEAKSKWLECEC